MSRNNETSYAETRRRYKTHGLRMDQKKKGRLLVVTGEGELQPWSCRGTGAFLYHDILVMPPPATYIHTPNVDR